MDWVKVAKALDDEWATRTQFAQNRPNDPDASRQALLGHAAFMLRDCLVAGMSEADKEKVFDRSDLG